MDFESQDATKISSALADPRICSSMKMMTLDMHMNAITIFLSVSPSFSSSAVTMSTSKLTGVCMTNSSYQKSVLKDHDCPFLEDFHARKKHNTILTLKVKTMDGMAQKTNGVLCWIPNNIISLDQLVSLLFSLLLWNVRPPRNMCGEIEYVDAGWMNGVLCHEKFKNKMLVMRSSLHLRLLRSSPHLRLLRECSQGSGHVC